MDLPIEAMRASLMLDMLRAERQAALAMSALRTSPPDEREAALKALEHAHDRLATALAGYIDILQSDDADDDRAAHDRPGIAPAMPAETAWPGGTVAEEPPGESGDVPLGGLINRCAADIAALRAALRSPSSAPAAGTGQPYPPGGAPADPWSASSVTPSVTPSATPSTGGDRAVVRVRLEAAESRLHAVEQRLIYLEAARDAPG